MKLTSNSADLVSGGELDNRPEHSRHPEAMLHGLGAEHEPPEADRDGHEQHRRDTQEKLKRWGRGGYKRVIVRVGVVVVFVMVGGWVVVVGG